MVAIGGGSAIDVGKAVAILMAHDGTSREYALGQKELQRQGLPFIAVPTTSGSSSEVTSSAALWDMEAQRSMALSHPLMFPTVSVVDPELAMSMPKTLAAVTGMDAFTSAIEGYWSLESEPATDALDLEVVRLYAANLERSCIQGDLESRTACALAATVSGIACSNSHVNVCHAIGGPLTLFWGVDHGHSVAITLPAFLRWNAPAISHKLPALWDALGVGDLEEAVTRITQMLERCGLETRLHGLGLGDGDLETVVTNMSRDRLGLVPQPLEMEDIRALLRELI